jgi:hypothetical protein
MARKWYEAGDDARDQAVENFLASKRKVKAPTLSDLFSFFKGRQADLPKEIFPEESTALRKLRERLAKDPTNPYLLEAIKGLEKK